MRERLLVDTGILVSAVVPRDQWAGWTAKTMESVYGPFYTCEAVLTETWFLLHKYSYAWQSIAQWIERGHLQIQFPMKDHSSSVLRLIEKYKNLPMSIADASLVAMVENDLGDRVFTLDKHFRLYRHSGRRVTPVLMPD